jgi:ferritin-like protein
VNILGKILAGSKARENEEKNRKRLDEAALNSRKLAAMRINDSEIKQIIIRLTYEADIYISASRESEGCYYAPLVLDSLDNACAALNVFLKADNDAAVEKYFSVSEETKTENKTTRERLSRILNEALRLFMEQNNIRSAGNTDSANTELGDPNGSR